MGCKNSTEYTDKCARDLGYKDHNERRNEHDWNIEEFPVSEYIECPTYFGVYIAENYIMKTFEDPIKAPNNNIGYDWTCKNGYKIDCKASCLNHLDGKTPRWKFNIHFNNIADYFILSAWDNRYSLKPMYVWIFHKNDIVRGKKFWRRDNFNITNNPEYLKEFEKYETTDRLEKLRKICDMSISLNHPK